MSGPDGFYESTAPLPTVEQSQRLIDANADAARRYLARTGREWAAEMLGVAQ